MTTRTSYDRALSLERGSTGAFAVLAMIGHLGVGSVLARHARAASAEPPPVATEVEFIAPPEAPKPPAPREEPREDRVLPAATAAPAPARVAVARPSAPAKAGAVMTAAPGSEGPVSFVSDPNGGEYGQGVVAVNGSGSGAGGGPPVVEPTTTISSSNPSAPPPPPPPPKKVATPPRLAEANACRGFFPGSADDDTATVAVLVPVDANGRTTAATVVSESPRGQGFGGAARACVVSRRFVPATGEDGAPTSATATVNVHFSR